MRSGSSTSEARRKRVASRSVARAPEAGGEGRPLGATGCPPLHVENPLGSSPKGSPISCLCRLDPAGAALHGEPSMKPKEATDRPVSGQGFFPFPNRLLAEGCRRPVVLAVYAFLASTPAIWTRRGKLGEYEARASWTDLANTTGATVKKVRGALAWLAREGFVTCVDPGGKRRAATYRLEVERAQNESESTPTTPTPYGESDKGKGRISDQKGSKEGAKATQANMSNGNGLHDAPDGQRAHNGAHVLEDCKTKTTTPPQPPREGGSVSRGGYCLAVEWGRAFLLAGVAVPPEPQAKSLEPYRRTVLAKLPHKSENERDAVFRAMQAHARNGAGGVREFVKAEHERREGAEVERAYRKRHGIQDGPVVPVPPKDEPLPPPMEEGEGFLEYVERLGIRKRGGTNGN